MSIRYEKVKEKMSKVQESLPLLIKMRIFKGLFSNSKKSSICNWYNSSPPKKFRTRSIKRADREDIRA